MHIMLDLETWGTTPGSDIRSIGACVFDPVAGWPTSEMPLTEMALDGKTFYIACNNPMATMLNKDGELINLGRRYDLQRDPRTVQWWSEQSAEAQAAFANPVDLREALRQFTAWIDDVSRVDVGDFTKPFDRQHVRLWGHGAAFDPPILAVACAAVGLPVPWHYRAPRDTRTLFDHAGIDDHSAFMQRFNHGTYHHALDDAISQARAVCAAW